MLSWSLLSMMLLLYTVRPVESALFGLLGNGQSCQMLMGWFVWEYWLPGDRFDRLSTDYCNNFQSFYTAQGMTEQLDRFNQQACKDAIVVYFHDIYFDESDRKFIKTFAETCVAAELSEIDCASLVIFLKKYCWTMVGVVTYINLMKDSGVDLKTLSDTSEAVINYDDYLAMAQHEPMHIRDCLHSGRMRTTLDVLASRSYLSSFNKFKADRPLARYNCDCYEVISVIPFFSKSTYKIPYYFMESSLSNRLTDICTDREKTSRWSESQLAYMTQEDTLKTVEAFSGASLRTFFTQANVISMSKWHMTMEDNDWTLVQVMNALGLDSSTQLNTPQMYMVESAINNSMLYANYSKFLTSVANVTDDYDHWNCRYLLFQAIFTKPIQASANHWSKHSDQSFDHIAQLIKLADKDELQDCSNTAMAIENIETIFCDMDQWDLNIMAQMLNWALANKRTLSYTSKCLSLVATIEKEISNVDFTETGLEQFSADMIEERLATFREKVFDKETEFCWYEASYYTSDNQLMANTFFKTDASVVLPSSDSESSGSGSD